MATPPKQERPAPSTAASPASSEPRNFLATFLLAAFAGTLGLRHFYTGNAKLGWIRLGLLVGGYIWVILFSIQRQEILVTLGTLAVFTAAAWAIVDFFYVYFKVRTDAFGQPLTTTAYDKKWTKIIFWVIIGLNLLAIAVSSILVITALTNPNYTPTTGGNSFDTISSPRSETVY